MTPQEIRDMTVPDETYPNERYGEIFVPLLGTTVEFVVLEHDPKVPMPQVAADCVNDFLAYGSDRLSELADALAQNCRGHAVDFIEGVEYESYTLNQSEANKVNWVHYGLNADGTPPAGWVDPEWLSHVNLIVAQQDADTKLIAHFVVPWEEEHGADVYLGADGLLSD